MKNFCSGCNGISLLVVIGGVVVISLLNTVIFGPGRLAIGATAVFSLVWGFVSGLLGIQIRRM